MDDHSLFSSLDPALDVKEDASNKGYSLARFYRPRFFKDVLGQDLFVQLISQGLKENKLGQGILLTGIRGVGKTTLARLIGKSLCCGDRKEGFEPCGECFSCVSWEKGGHLDILEMDAASHTSVDDIRTLTESCFYQGVMSPHKIFIIDEVHMLSKSAFNALLKTLEEPPAHVRFIFATTEVQKVPLTILSRCQKFHLQRIVPDVVMQILKKVAQHEGYDGNDAVFQLMAQHSEGSARDALRLLESVMMGVEGKNLSIPDVKRILGVVPEESMEILWQALKRGEAEKALNQGRLLLKEGFEPSQILKNIMNQVHAEWTRPNDEKSLKSSINFEGADEDSFFRLDTWWQMLEQGVRDVEASAFPFLALEMVIYRLAYSFFLPSPMQLLQGIEGVKENSILLPSLENMDVKEDKSLGSENKQEVSAGNSVAQEEIWKNLLAHLESQRQPRLYAHLFKDVVFLGYQEDDSMEGHWSLKLHWKEDFNSSLRTYVQEELKRWMIQWKGKPGIIQWNQEPQSQGTLAEISKERLNKRREHALNHPWTQEILEAFPKANLEEIS